MKSGPKAKPVQMDFNSLINQGMDNSLFNQTERSQTSAQIQLTNPFNPVNMASQEKSVRSAPNNQHLGFGQDKTLLGDSFNQNIFLNQGPDNGTHRLLGKGEMGGKANSGKGLTLNEPFKSTLFDGVHMKQDNKNMFEVRRSQNNFIGLGNTESQLGAGLFSKNTSGILGGKEDKKTDGAEQTEKSQTGISGGRQMGGLGREAVQGMRERMAQKRETRKKSHVFGENPQKSSLFGGGVEVPSQFGTKNQEKSLFELGQENKAKEDEENKRKEEEEKRRKEEEEERRRQEEERRKEEEQRRQEEEKRRRERRQTLLKKVIQKKKQNIKQAKISRLKKWQKKNNELRLRMKRLLKQANQKDTVNKKKYFMRSIRRFINKREEVGARRNRSTFRGGSTWASRSETGCWPSLD